MKAKVAYSYGWTDREIMSMPWESFLEYWKAITPIEAQKALADISVFNYSKMKKENRQKLDRKLRTDAYSSIDNTEGRLANYNDVLAKISGKK